MAVSLHHFGYKYQWKKSTLLKGVYSLDSDTYEFTIYTIDKKFYTQNYDTW